MDLFTLPSLSRRVWVAGLPILFGGLVVGALLSRSAPSWHGQAALAELDRRGEKESLLVALETARYSARPVDTRADAFATANAAQGLRAEFAIDGVTLSNGRSRVWIRPVGVGYGDTLVPMPATGIAADGTRVEIARVAAGTSLRVDEWWVNRPAGLEQGYTIHGAPARQNGASWLRVGFAIEGDLQPRVAADGQSAEFENASGAAILRYDHLLVTDAEGRKLPARMRSAGATMTLETDDSHAVYPITIDPTWAQQAYLKASNTGPVDVFGDAVAISGDTAVIGAPLEQSAATGVDGDQTDNSKPDAGAAYVFIRNGNAWQQQAYLKASNTDVNDRFGESVAISGNTLVIGARGEGSAATGVDGNQADNSLYESGAAYVFVRHGTTWTQEAYLKASNTSGGDYFGAAVAVSGDTVVVGARLEDSSATGINGNQLSNTLKASGAVYVFERNGGQWAQEAYLKASNTSGGDTFGTAVAVDGDTIAVGAPGEDSSATGVDGNQTSDGAPGAGAAYVFIRNAGLWTQQAYLKASNTGGSDGFGTSIAAFGDTIAVGAPGEDSDATGIDGNGANNGSSDAGAAYVYVRSAGTWTPQAYIKASNTSDGDSFGLSVSGSGETVVVGARGEDSASAGIDGNQTNDSASNAGAAYVFTRSAGTWAQHVYVKASNPDSTDWFGHAVAVSGNTVIVGAPFEMSAATGVNGNQDDDSVSGAGAAYVFLRGPDAPTITGITSGDEMLTVDFTAGGDDGGSPLTNYEYSINDGGSWTPREPADTASPLVITGLGNGTGYTIRIRAVNAEGPGAQSAPFDATPMTVPDAPTGVIGIAGNGRVIVSFTPPADNGGSPITNYTVTAEPGGTTATGTASPIAMNGLTNGVAYTFTVFASNIVCDGPASEPSAPVTPVPPPMVDLNGDGRGDALLYNSTTGHWSRQVSLEEGGFAEESAGNWAPGWTVTPANFDLDGRTDFLLFNETTGDWVRMLNDGGTGFTTQSAGMWWNGWQVHVMKLDGDAVSDVFLYDPATGVWFKCVTSPDGFDYDQGGWDPNWELHPMKLDPDGLDDLFLINRTTGIWFWVLGQPGPGFTYPVSDGWYPNWVLHVGDFNGDGLGDLLLHDPPTGVYFVATNNGAGFSYQQDGWSLGWTPYVLDLNGDQKDDVFLHDPSTGVWAKQINSCGTFTTVGSDGWSEGWQIFAMDFNSDDRGDILLYHPESGVWFQAVNLFDNGFNYVGGASWMPGLTVITKGPLR